MNKRALKIEKRRQAAIQRARGLIERHQDEMMLMKAAQDQLDRGNVHDLVKLEYIISEGDWRQR